MINKV